MISQEILYVFTYEVVLLNDTVKACQPVCFHLLDDVLLCLYLDVHFSQSRRALTIVCFDAHVVISLTCRCVFFPWRY
jgi:hypothetical protein